MTVESSFELRLQQLYAAIGASKHELADLPAGRIRRIDGRHEVRQDFSGDASDAELANELTHQICHLGSFPDQLRYRLSTIAKKHRIPEVVDFFKRDHSSRILHDLDNTQKHAFRDRHGDGWSRERPVIKHIRRIARSRTQAKAGSVAGVGMDMATGKPQAIGDGESIVITTGEVLNNDGKVLGLAHEFMEGALKRCESAVNYFGAR